MLFSKFLLFVVAILAILTVDVEAKGRRHHRRHRRHHHNKWKKLVHHKCVGEDNATLLIGGKITREMIKTATRANKRKYTFGLVINGQDASKPTPRSHRRRNVRFLEAMAKSGKDIIAMPWSTRRSLRRMKLRRVARLYARSINAIEKVIGTRPTAIYVPPQLMYRKAAKYLSKKGYTLIGNTTDFKHPQHDTKKKSFIALQSPNPKRFSKMVRTTNNALFDIVDLPTCIGEPIYEGGLEDDAHQ